LILRDIKIKVLSQVLVQISFKVSIITLIAIIPTFTGPVIGYKCQELHGMRKRGGAVVLEPLFLLLARSCPKIHDRPRRSPVSEYTVGIAASPIVVP